MIKHLHDKLNIITDIPRPKRSIVSDILKECYKEGKVDQKRRGDKVINKLTKLLASDKIKI